MKIAGINFDHFHMGDLLRMVFDHPDVEICGICDEDPERMTEAARNFSIPEARIFTDHRACIEQTRPDLVILCPATAGHAEWVEKVAPLGVHILMEKPMAASLSDADRMIAAMKASGRRLAVNWPLVWYPAHRTAKRVIDEGLIGDPIEVHYYGGNRGPLYHVADKIEISEEEVQRRKPSSWFYKKDRGGGSLLDYLGYGVTLGTWLLDGKSPIEVTAVTDQPAGLEVDEHAVVIARYDCGLSKFETRWGTFTDPWTHQPQPKCGFVIVGTAGTVSSFDGEPSIRVQTRENPAGYEVPVDVIPAPHRNTVEHVVHCLRTGEPFIGPLTPEMSRTGQQIVDTAVISAAEKRTVQLVQ
ncbi:MAG: Gfo/Idh/MocA family protein [Blastocatellales bacterium]